ncbi:dipeptidase [Parasphingorhabdus cellanae]|uniref:Membrane dipeptidase n=1 Tax=Parasphingorhabdus cellanae TaxID=2806553 RepID=A0ABX7T2Q1_9SPHN|nr:membrane dipeptidase [Parasphingorhabdus cellanae]QTD55838.1 membrane dipeptidase [Parasphingorhabdus cellanae]
MCIICSSNNSSQSEENVTPVSYQPKQLEAGEAFLAKYPTIDIHAHPGRFFMNNAPETPFTSRYAKLDITETMAEIRASSISAVFFSTVADLPVLGFIEGGIGPTRELTDAEAKWEHNRQVDYFENIGADSGLEIGRSADDVDAAHEHKSIAGFLSIEGGDFIGCDIEKISEAAKRSVQSITIVHYRNNHIGDTQTQPPSHDGLSKFGQTAIKAMEDANILVDLSHASYDTVRGAARIASRPMMLSHSNIDFGDDKHNRLISAEHARLVTDGGGIVGAVPAGFGQQNFDEYIETILRMVDILGVDHIAIGTDMDFTYRSVMPNYSLWPVLAGSLLHRGVNETELAKIMGGNMVRIMQ